MRGFTLILLAFVLFACTAQKSSYTQPLTPVAAGRPDYDRLDFWAAHPHKADAADSVPAPLQKESRDTLADVFFIHPTTYTSRDGSGNADLSNTALNQKTDQSTILFQASAFNQHARVFAPRYRQAHLSSFYNNRETAAPLFDTAYSDVQTAFEHYLRYYHQDRPLIIAAHSQGAKLAIRLLQEYFDDKPLGAKLVAAYVVGWPVLRNDFRQLPVCSTPDATGCFVSWRTFKAGYVPDYIQEEEPAAWVTNPLTWRTDSVAAAFALNKGSVLRNFNKVVLGVADARVHGGVLWVSKLRFPGAFLLNTSNFHIGDINLFYVNIRRNVEERIGAYLKKQTNVHP
ncbi:Protein of unknown function [Cnuella takakiae]|uniref:DUF3089 domain-containing protein n=1 Tax=Cnuella takakiae TaxID=1302690 RepID=A0A1M5F8D0_9BACT|nr:DUF3089 domain-containing protein [Cnuella takakiae]OLY91006.1 hypothetical protein BUE76_03150 [Cnuella takakiae]SHF87638.1 Protein of unknown function [Cnuella takakiae]